MARHIFDLRFTIYDFVLRAKSRDNLTEGDPTIVGRHALVPIRLETFRLQPPRRPLGQITVLKTATAQHHATLAGLFGHGHHGLGQRVVKLRRYSANGDAL
jgi:hypothetical protein